MEISQSLIKLLKSLVDEENLLMKNLVLYGLRKIERIPNPFILISGEQGANSL